MGKSSGTALLPQRITHGRHCTCSACAREDWTRITAPCGMHGAECEAIYAPMGPAGYWRCPGCGFEQNGDHSPNTLCPFGIVPAIEAGWLTIEEAARRLETAA